jgi:inner membrane protein
VIIGTLFAISYWSLGWYQREQATNAMQQLAEMRGHTVVRYEVKPSIGNLLVWRAQYESAGNIHYDAFHTSPWHGDITYEGGDIPLFVAPETISAIQRHDLEYFDFFSDGWLAYAPEGDGLIGDMRFSMLPNQSGPIWGIRLQPERPNEHVLFENVRTLKEGDVARFWSMIKGNQL